MERCKPPKASKVKEKTRKAKPIPIARAVKSGGASMKIAGANSVEHVRMTGRDRLGSVFLPTALFADTVVLFMQAINPLALIQSRLARLAANWEKFRFSRFRVHYVSSAPTIYGGQLIGFIDPDAASVLAGDPETVISSANARGGAKVFSILTDSFVDLPGGPGTGLHDFFVDTTGDAKLWSQGNFFLVASMPLVAPSPPSSSAAVGYLEVEWEIELKVAQTQQIGTNIFSWSYWAGLLRDTPATASNLQVVYGTGSVFQYFSDTAVVQNCYSQLSHPSDDTNNVALGNVIRYSRAGVANERTFLLDGVPVQRLIGQSFLVSASHAVSLLSNNDMGNVPVCMLYFNDRGISFNTPAEGTLSGVGYYQTGGPIVSRQVWGAEGLLQAAQRPKVLSGSEKRVRELELKLEELLSRTEINFGEKSVCSDWRCERSVGDPNSPVIDCEQHRYFLETLVVEGDPETG